MCRLILAIAIAVWSLAGQDRYFDLLHISDTHVASFAGVDPELIHARTVFRDPGTKLEKFVEEAARIPRSRVVHTGDIVDAICFDAAEGERPVYGQIELVQRLLAPLPAPPLLVLGNHDVECYRRDPVKKNTAVGDQSVAAEARQLWAKAFPGLAKGSYYAQALEAGGKRYWLIAIDNGEALATGQRFFEEQMGWLERELARHAGEPAIVALHIPIGADAKSQAIRERLGRSARVQLILTGHRHTDLVDEVEAGGRKITQVRTAGMHVSATFWRQVRLWEDRIEVSATGEPGKIVATVRLEP